MDTTLRALIPCMALTLLTACSTPMAKDEEDQRARSHVHSQSDPLEAAAGEKSVEYRLDPESPRTPFTPDGITTIEVPSVVRKPKATYRISPDSPLKKLKARDMPSIGGSRKKGVGVPLSEVDDQKFGDLSSSIPEDLDRPSERPTDSRAPIADPSFDGPDFDDNATEAGSLFIPPDPMAAAGPTHLVAVVNVIVEQRLKDGTLVDRFSLADFFADLLPLTATFDPKVIYDQYAERFVIVTLEQTESPTITSRIFVAVSDDSNPEGTWYVFAIPAVLNFINGYLRDFADTVIALDHFADYPGLAVDEEAIYITANMFSFPFEGSRLFGGVRLWIIDKGLETGGFYDGGASTTNLYDPFFAGLAGVEATAQPAHVFGTAPSTPNVGTFLATYSGISDGTNEFLQIVRVDDPLGTTSFTPQGIDLGNLETLAGPLAGAPQSGDIRTIATNDRRALDAVWRDGSLWTTASVSLPDVTGPEEVAAHWWRVDTSDLSMLTLADQGAINGEDIAPETYTFFPSIAVNRAGDLAVGFSASAATISPGSYYTTFEEQEIAEPTLGQRAAIGTGSQTLRQGLASYYRAFGNTENRWGDYSGAAVDPVDDCFWIFNEHAITQGTPTSGQNGRWGTAFGRACVCDQSIALTPTGWTQISLSCDPGSLATIAEIFGDDLDGNYGEDWGIYEWDATNQTYTFLTESATLVLGRGYWLATQMSSQTVGVEGIGNSVFEIPLVGDPDGRSNQVGHPFDFDVCWQDVRIIDADDSVLDLSAADPDNACQEPDPVANGCRMSRIANKWNGNAYSPFDGVTPTQTGTLVPWDGFWVKAFRSGLRLRIPATPGNCGAPAAPESGRTVSSPTVRQPTDSRSSRPGGWHIRLTASTGQMQDSGTLGQLPGSKRGYDSHDLAELSPFGANYLTVVFPHPEWQARPGDFATDFHPLKRASSRDEWEFAVKTSAIGEEVTLTWEGPAKQLVRAVLVDLKTGYRQRLRAGDSYTFTVDAESHSFALQFWN